MKKALSALFVFILATAALLGLTSCGKGETQISFIVDGETYATVKFEDDGAMKLPNDPTKEGYTFAGWYFDETLETPFTLTAFMKLDVAGNVPVYAKWTENGVHVHTASDWIVDTEPTCAKAGAKHKECTECGAVLEEEVVTAAHTPAEAVKENEQSSTCTALGHYDSVVYCSVCHAEISREEKELAKLHNVQSGACTFCGARESSADLSFKLNADGESYTVIDMGTCTDTDVVVGIYNNRDVTGIAYGAFANCRGIKTVTVEKGVTSVGDSAFKRCTGLTSISFPDSVTGIGFEAFSGCKALEKIRVPSGITSIGGDSFEECTSLKYNEYDNAYYIGNEENPYLILVKAKNTSITSCTVNDNAKIILSEAFVYCFLLADISIPESVTYIDEAAFEGTLLSLYDSSIRYTEYGNAYYLGNEENPYLWLIKAKNNDITSCTVNENAKHVYPFAFTECESLVEINVEDGNASYKSIDGNVYSKDGKTLVRYAPGKTATSFAIPDGTTCIGECAFFNSTSLINISVPDSVTTIEMHGFGACASLLSLELPEGITSIGACAFQGCISLGSINIPEGMASISWTTFGACASLTSITIPDGITHIGDYAFFGCTALTSVSVPDSVISLGDFVFSGCAGLTSVSIPDSVTRIGDSMFMLCTSLASVSLPDSVTSIGELVFAGCTALTSISIPDSVTSLDGYAFTGCTELTSVTLGGGLTRIDVYMFSNCTNLASITIPNSVTSIDYGAFDNCTSLTSVYYAGSAADWETISIELGNSDLESATLYCYSESRPTEAGSYWHYDASGNIAVWN